ncbi:MAG: GNAT family N-acetyltransferase [Methanomassiliicoccus sp.]|nr:GNAT family N-acetyltransferase [Methanomassiliicoccus sp.]
MTVRHYVPQPPYRSDMIPDAEPYRPIPLITERLVVRGMRMEDVDALFSIKSDPSVTHPYAQEPHRSRDETQAWMERVIAEMEQGLTLYWTLVLKDEGAVIGACCLWNFGPGRTCAEVGYELHRAYWNRGIMAEALAAIIDHSFGPLGLHRLEANPLGANRASIMVLERLGFVNEGRLRQRIPFRGRFEDQLYYGLLKEEWKGRPDH